MTGSIKCKSCCLFVKWENRKIMNMRKFKLLIVCMLLLTAFLNFSVAESGPTKPNKYIKGEITKIFKDGRIGIISWKTRYVTAKGMAPSPPNAYSPAQAQLSARTAAILDAQRYLLEVIQGVQVDVTTCVSDYMVSEVQRKHIQGVIKDYEITNEDWDGGIYEVTMQVPMGRLIKTFVHEKDETPNNRPTIYTGLVIDTREVNLTPAIFINIYNERGAKVCGPIHIIYRVTGNDIEDVQEKRLGHNPLRVSAKRTSGKNNVDVIISNEDADEITNNVINTKIISKGNVVALIN
jgi:hypothetical protein